MELRRLLPLAVLLVSGQGSKPGGREAFGAAFQRLQSQVELAPDVAVVRKDLLGLLEAHKDKEYVLARRRELEVLAKACAFRAAVKKPDPKKLVSGELLLLDRINGRIKLRYTPRTLSDFGGVGTERETTASGGSAHLHPVVFCGPHNVEIRGKEYPGGPGPALEVCVTKDDCYHIIMGSEVTGSGWYQPSITYFSGVDHTEELAKKEHSPCKSGKPYTIRVQVTPGQIQVLYNGQVHLQAKKKSEGFGHFRFRAHGTDYDELFLEGRVEPSWIQRLEDSSTQSQREAFEKSFDLRQHLPAWLLDAKAAPAAAKADGEAGNEDALHFPEALTEEGYKLVERALKYANSDKPAKGVEWLRGQSDDALPPATRNYFLALLHWYAEQLPEAIQAADLACSNKPDAPGSRWLRARILAAAGGRTLALSDYQWLVQSDLGRNSVIHVELIELLLRMGRFAEARSAMDKVQELGLTHKLLEQTRQRLLKATQGPTWARRFASSSANYVVASDINEALCAQAVKVLEEGLKLFAADLEKLPADLEKQQFKVFLFGGEVGYQAYCKDLGDTPPRHTAGLYYPGIKQLLIWNVPRREDMLRTVRHEGFHQYLDRLMADPPRWFNEGMAEYFEEAEQKGGKWVLGAARTDHLSTLRENPAMRLPLVEFVKQNDAVFMANADINYAQSWAFVHFLRHGPEKHRPLFKALWQALREGKPAPQAVALVLPPPVLTGLQADFDRHLFATR